MMWVGLFSSLLMGKLVYYITPQVTATATHYVTMRVETIGSVGQVVTQNPLFQASVLYFLNNFLTSLLIMVFFIIFARGKDDESYFTSCVIFYLLCVFMPMSGLIGGSLPFTGFFAIIPHGLFELFAVALGVTVGMKYSYKYYITRCLDLRRVPFFVLCMGLFLVVAGLFEPVDWCLFYHSQVTSQSLPDLLLRYYIGM
jgi:uncharacterized membrane protein SpoIIM required for sporulation